MEKQASLGALSVGSCSDVVVLGFLYTSLLPDICATRSCVQEESSEMGGFESLWQIRRWGTTWRDWKGEAFPFLPTRP